MRRVFVKLRPRIEALYEQADAIARNRTLRKPNFFIAGAPRCGTTSMWSYLKQHPDIFMSAEKELYFFDSDLWAREEWAPSLEEYLGHFRSAGSHRVIGEATPSYLRSQRAPGAIKRFNPEARILIMLRNPVDVMHSLHSQGLRYGTEPVTDFASALEADTKRLGRDQLGYRQFATFGYQVQRYFDLFGRERVHTIIFDDLKDDFAGVCRGTLHFLGVSPVEGPGVAPANANLQVRSARMQRLLVRPPRTLRRIGRAVLPEALRTRIARALSNSNIVVRPRPPVNPHLRRQLEEEFAADIHRLGQLLGRDLSTWLRVSERQLVRAERTEA